MTPSELLSELRRLGPMEPDELLYFFADQATRFRREDGSPVHDALSFGLFFRAAGMLAESEKPAMFDFRKTQLLRPAQRRWNGEDTGASTP